MGGFDPATTNYGRYTPTYQNPFKNTAWDDIASGTPTSPKPAPTSTTPTYNISPTPAPTSTTTVMPTTSSLPSISQDALYQQAVNSIFNPQPSAAWQMDMSDFPFISGAPTATSMGSSVRASSLDPSQYGANLGQNTAAGNIPPDIISMAQTQQAIEGLLNPQSLFDTMSGGPIVDEINARTNALQDAFRTQQMHNLDEGIAKVRAQLAADGVLSGSDIINEQFDFTQGVLNDIAVFDSGLGLENMKYLGDLAYQDLIMRSNNLQRVLIESNLQRGMNIEVAVADADRKSREIIAQAEIQVRIAEANLQAQTQAAIANAQIGSNASIANAQIAAQQNMANLDAAKALQLAQLQAQTQLALGGQAAGVDVLGLMQQDYANQLGNQINTMGLPLNALAGLGGPVQSTSSSSKSI